MFVYLYIVKQKAVVMPPQAAAPTAAAPQVNNLYVWKSRSVK